MGMAYIQDAGNGAKSNDIIFKQFKKKPSLHSLMGALMPQICLDFCMHMVI